MPEGHAIYRLAREHKEELAGRRFRVSSPQGRAEAAAERLDGRALEDVEAQGKHLFYRFGERAVHGSEPSKRRETLHVHLGRFGRFLRDLPAPRATARLRFETAGLTLDLVGPAAAAVVEPAVEATIRARLGPDPLRGADPEPTWAALRGRRIPIGAAMLDQRLFAGVGNIFRIEALHALGVDPRRAASELSRAELDALWQLLARMMRRSVAAGRIVSAPRGGRWVYGRDDCATCGAPVERYMLGGRPAYSCPACQTLESQPAARSGLR